MLTDHYAVLGLSPAANPNEIKTAYRRLARMHHPDLNPGTAEATDQFRAIQLAYETLTRPHLRQAYLEKRWYAQYHHQRMEAQALTLERILQQSIELERFVAALDPNRLDQKGLYHHIKDRLTDWEFIDFNIHKERDTVTTVLSLILLACQPLALDNCEAIHQQLTNWLSRNQADTLLLRDWLEKKARAERIQKWWPVWALLLTIAIAVLIWRVG